jgi:hypothetical protein
VLNMDRAAIEQILGLSEAAAASGTDLAGTGFWKAVTAVKGDRATVDDYADRIGRIDRAAFERWPLVKVPISVGTIPMVIGSGVGLALIGWSYRLSGNLQGLALLIGTGIILVTTHGLAHLVTGSLQGMRFTHWFISGWRRPQPGVKVDYATYLRVPARSRAWMHASGALVTKFIPFLSLGAGWAMEAPGWAMALLAALGLAQIVTDIVWSTKKSDWKKFARERSLAS